MKMGTIDIETFPGSYRSWGPMWEATLMKEDRPVMAASFAYKELGKKEMIVKAAWQYRRYKDFVKELWKVFDENDVLIGHNIKKFDLTQSNTFFAQMGMKKPSDGKFIDTYSICKNNFKLPSYKLKYLLVFFGIGMKLATGGDDLWFAAEDGDKKKQKQFLQYNANDTVMTEKLYLFLRENGWIKNHPGDTFYTVEHGCPRCHKHKVHRRGEAATAEGIRIQYACINCGKRSVSEELVRKW